MRVLAEETKANILREQFIPDHLFIYIAKGALRVYDGTKNYVFRKGDAFLARKNRLAKYELLDAEEGFEPILFCFDEPFLKEFQSCLKTEDTHFSTKDSFLEIQKSALLDSFIQSIKPYYIGAMQLDEAFEDLKYRELLVILLKTQPELSGILFDFRTPGKIDLEKFLNENYKFNISVERFAFMTGRSLSAFKRDFHSIYSETPSRWLVKRRLDEAHFLIEKKHQKPSNIYLDLGFETLSHFSVAFKKQFGISPSGRSKHS